MYPHPYRYKRYLRHPVASVLFATHAPWFRPDVNVITGERLWPLHLAY